MDWNDPNSIHYCSEFEYQICEILNNLVCSDSFNSEASITTTELMPILDRYRSFIFCRDIKLRRETVLFFANLMMNSSSDKKLMIIQKYDLIYTLLQLLLQESNARIILNCVEFIEYAIIRDVQSYDSENETVDPQNVDFKILEIFNCNNGVDILMEIKDRFCNNRDILDKISIFE